MTDNRLRLTRSCACLLVILAGCTAAPETTQTPPSLSGPTTQRASPPAASPTPANSRDVIRVEAMKTVEGYLAARDRLLAHPSRFTETQATKALEPYSGKDMLDGYVALFAQLRRAGKHYKGPARLSWIDASAVFGSGVGESVNVTVCRDSTGRKLVDREGAVLADVKPAIREFEVRKLKDGLRIVGEKEGFGEPCP